MIATPSMACSWGQENFGSVQLRDQRRNRSLVDLADRILQHPGGSLPDKFNGDTKALNRCYDLMNSPHVTHAAVLSPHRQRTFQLLRAHDGVVLNVFDQTELNLTGKRSLAADVGQIGNGHGRGYICHNGLAIDPRNRSAFGLVNQILHVRDEVPPKETRAQKRARQTRESLLWLKGMEGLELAPEGKLWVDVCDAGSDTFEFLDYEDLRGRKYVIRAAQDRRIVVGHEAGGPQPLLWEYVRSLAAAAERPLHVPARAGRLARDTVVAVAWAAVQLCVPRHRNGEHRQQAVAVWAIRVWEVNPAPDVAEPVEWILLTNLAVTSVAEAWEKVDWYTCRWVVEEYHKGQKTGCAIEAPQFTTPEALQPMIALLSVVAVALLNLRDLSRRAETKDLPAERVVPAEHVEVLSAWRYGERRALTVAEFTLALARLGGHLNRKGDHPPGWLVLWRGWTKLHLLVEGARAARRLQSKDSKTTHNRSP
jgi:Transposase DNA-binding/Transposase Tn5 dimerisation domain